ncbi:MAG: tetratricopeptide repeat protein [Gemmatimonadota bacterium]|jgi:TolB-like protein/Tfp pilus assembly protein PilF
MSELRRLLQEAGRRHVARVAVVYAAVAFAVLEATDIVIPALGWPDWAIRWVIALALIGFPITLILAWIYDLTPKGVVRTKSLEEAEVEGVAHRDHGPPFVSAILLLASGALVAMGAFFTFQWSQSNPELPGDPIDTGELTMSPRRVAVLPFEAMGTSDPGDFFANGIHEDILNHLAKIDGLEVISRTTVLQYEDTRKSAQEIGRELDAGSILEGSVRRQGSQVRVVAQLIDTRTETHVWSETFDSRDTDVFAVQSEIAQEIASALQVELTTEELAELEAAPAVVPEAYDRYLEGLGEWDLRENRINAFQAARLFQEATEIDPEYANAFSALSQARMWIFWNFPGAQNQAALATQALDRAVALAPNAVETRLAQGYFHFYGRGDPQEALRHFAAAEEQKPSDAGVITAIGLILRGQGRWEEALAAFERARTYDYRSYNLIYTLGETNLRMRRWEEAERYLQLATSLAPDVGTAYRDLLRVRLAATGDTVAAREYIETLPGSRPSLIRSLLEAELAYYRGDLRTAMGRAATEIPASRGREENPRIGLGTTYERRALLYHLMGETGLRDAYADSLRMASQEVLEAAAANPGPVQTGVIARAHAKLGLSYALLGEPISAVAEGSTAVSSLSIQDDAYAGADHLRDLVLIYLLIGVPDLAVQELQTALSIPSPLTIVELTLDPLFEPLRNHPSYPDLLASVQ